MKILKRQYTWQNRNIEARLVLTGHGQFTPNESVNKGGA